MYKSIKISIKYLPVEVLEENKNFKTKMNNKDLILFIFSLAKKLLSD